MKKTTKILSLIIALIICFNTVYISSIAAETAEYIDNQKINNYGDYGWEGQTEPPIYLLHPNYATMKLNDYYHTAGGSLNHESELVAHETGHALKLDDYEPLYGTLMRSSGYNGYPNPTLSDIAGVNETY